MGSENKYTNEDLRKMQSWDFARKVAVTQTRIIEWYEKNDGKVYVSFSGGKDSTVLLDLVRRIYPDCLAVYIDTGLEYPELKQFVKSKSNIKILRPEMSFRKVIDIYGYPLISKSVSRAVSDVRRLGKTCYSASCFGYKESCYKGSQTGLYNYSKYKYLIDAPFKVSNKCCDIMKKKPAHKFEKESGLKPILATMACESQLRRTAWLQNGCNSFNAKRPISQPMSFWTEQDVLKYLLEFEIPYCSVYGDILKDDNDKYYTTGCSRTGCIFCGFGCHLDKEPNRFQLLKQTHPQLWEYCMKDVDSGGLGMKSVLEYIDIQSE